MGLRFGCARALSAISTWGLKNVFHRPAANFPGKIALYADPRLIADLRGRLTCGSLCVVGTNGKTTVTNMLADAFEVAGKTVACNRTGANLDSGVATTLLHTKRADWGIFECDELWLAKILPHLQANYVLLLNLFRDQLDRSGEIDHIQQSIVRALKSSPATVLVYNSDDPLCQAIADKAGNPSIAFGVTEELALSRDSVVGGRICQNCATILEYSLRQYGQLGDYKCPNCGFARTAPVYTATDVEVGAESITFDAAGAGEATRITAPLPGVYMVYNLLACYAMAREAGVPASALTQAVSVFDPKNGRLQKYALSGREVILNLAKNPTGFNRNIDLVLRREGPKAIGFFINDKEADGHDVSWLWDVDFQDLASDPNLVAYAGGIRGHDMQVRLKYAGVNAQLVEGAADMLAHIERDYPEANAYFIANYTALPQVKAELDDLAAKQPTAVPASQPASAAASQSAAPAILTRVELPPVDDAARPLVIAHMFPNLLNLYGDSGCVTILADRVRRRGLPVEVVQVNEQNAESFDMAQADIVFLGGGPDREQNMASKYLLQMKDALRDYVEDGGALLAICGGYQIIGDEWLMGDEAVPGLNILNISTRRVEGGSHNRLVGNIVLKSPLAEAPVVGFENHAGRTFLGEGLEPFGRVMGGVGNGNNDDDAADGVLYKNVVGTYLHGPLLAKNPEVADALIARAIERRARIEGTTPQSLSALDDAAELEANEYMCKRLKAL